MNKLFSLILLTVVVCLVGLVLLVIWRVCFELFLSLFLGAEMADNLSLLAWVVLFFLPWGRFHTRKPYQIVGEIVIDCTAAEVWDALELRTRTDYFTPSLRHVVDEGDGRFRLVSDLEDVNVEVLVQVTHAERAAYLRYDAINASELPLWGRDLLNTEYTLTPVGPGQTHVRLVETLRYLRIGSFLAMLFLNASRDGLKALKAYCEGGETTSWLQQESEAIRGGGMALTSHAVWIVGLTMAILTTAIAFTLISLAF